MDSTQSGWHHHLHHSHMLRRAVLRITVAFKSLKISELLSGLDVMSEKLKNAEKRAASDEDQATVPAKKAKKDPVPVMQGRMDRKRKVALLLAYSGAGYYGIQWNPGFPTIESELYKALVKVGLVPDNIDSLQKISFQRAARTDKGVSAVGQVVSLKMLLNVENLVEKINENLPDQIRVLGYKRTTNSFNSKNSCSARTYIYMCPTYSFAPIETVISQDYRIPKDKVEQINEVLSMYKGTKNFHNFTSGRRADDPSSRRYIIEFKCGNSFVRENMEFVIITVKGQSFMMHHIRKMIGLTIAVLRGFCGKDVIEKAWGSGKLDVPKAPGLGLVLDVLHYDAYNKRFGNDGIHEKLSWDEYKDQIDHFKEEHIISNIMKSEKEEKVMLLWLTTLHNHTFHYDESGNARMSPLHHLSIKLKGKQKEEAESQICSGTDLETIALVDHQLSASSDIKT